MFIRSVTIRVILHDQQRYDTVGDWFFEGEGNLVIRVSELGDWRYAMLVGVHELVECLLCQASDISQDKVDEFDLAYEAMRRPDDVSEPGDSLDAPYQRQHCIATGIERLLCAELGIPWSEYDDAVETLGS